MGVTNLLNIHTRAELYKWYLENHDKAGDFWLRTWIHPFLSLKTGCSMPSRPMRKPGQTTIHSLKPTAASVWISFRDIGNPAERKKFKRPFGNSSSTVTMAKCFPDGTISDG